LEFFGASGKALRRRGLWDLEAEPYRSANFKIFYNNSALLD